MADTPQYKHPPADPKTTQRAPDPPGTETATEEGTTPWIKYTMGAIFYIGLTVYLLASIDHVAWFFHLYEPVIADREVTWGDLLPSYGKAGALDLAVFFLAYIAATGKTADKAVTWLFTGLLSGISLYANYIYAMYYNPEQQANVWNIELIFGITTGWLSPLIASSYPLFAMIFLYLIERVVSRKAETIAQMRTRLTASQERAALEQQLKDIKRGQAKEGIKSLIDNSVDLFNHAKNKARNTASSGDQSENKPEEQEPSIASDHQDQSENNAASSSDENDIQSSLQSRMIGTINAEETDQPQWKWISLRGRSTVPLEQAAQMLGVSVNRVKDLRKRGTLKTAALNVNRITIASIKAYDLKRSSASQRGKVVPFNSASINTQTPDGKAQLNGTTESIETKEQPHLSGD